MNLDLIQQACEILRQGGLVGLPTETVYGLAADARNEQAIQKVFRAKGRPADHPLIVHIDSPDKIGEWAREVPDIVSLLAARYWPGPLTLILKKRDSVLNSITGGQDTVAIRIPNHPVALQLLKSFGSGLVAPSANQFGQISPTDERAVQSELGAKVDLILPGGRSSIGLESTILDLHQHPYTVMRQGMLLQSELENFLGESLCLPGFANIIRTPGLVPMHYAPNTPLQLFDIKDLPVFLNQNLIVLAQSPQPDFALQTHWIKMPINFNDYAYELYAALRTADTAGKNLILVETPLHAPEWAAIHDRLQRAALKTKHSKK